MESTYGFKNFDIKNRTCYYFDDIIKTEDFDFDNISIDEKSYENVLAYKISYKTLIGAKPLRIRFGKVHEFIISYDETRHLVFFEQKYRAIFDRIRYLIGVKRVITYVISHNYIKINVDSHDISQFIMHIQLVLNKDQNHYYYNILLEKGSYQLPKNNKYK